MKLKIITAFMAILVIAMTIVSCVSLPIEKADDTSSFGEEHSGQPSHAVEESRTESEIPENSDEESKTSLPETSHEESVGAVSAETPSESPSEPPVESSNEPSTEPPEESSEPVSQEISEPVSEEVSEPVSQPSDYVYIPDVEGLPYTSYEGITKSKIKASEYDDYFKDSMFIGLSVFVHFSNYVSSMKTKYPGFLGNAIIFARSNFSAYNNFRYKPSDADSVHPKLNGEKMTCEDAVKASGVNTVYLSIMALNELGIYSTDCVKRTYDSTVKLIKAIQEKSPTVRVVILSNTYMVYNKNNYKNLNNGNISALNNMVLDYCNANGLDFIDVSTMLMDGNVLADKYCKDIDDGGCHINDTGFAIWTCVLRNYAYLKQKGLYKNPAKMPTYTKNK